MTREARRRVAFGVVLLVAISMGATMTPEPSRGDQPAVYIPVPAAMLAPVVVEDQPEAPRTPTVAPSASPTAEPTERPTPRPTEAPRPTQPLHAIEGEASWYCSPSQPVCVRGYPPGSMVAAACGKLRAAMGANWRGQTVTVTGANGTVTVVLVDWCGSTDKTIDLYWGPMRLLGGTGVLWVTVAW